MTLRLVDTPRTSTILVVDDESTIHSTFDELLTESSTVEVLHAQSGEEAVGVLEGRMISCVVVDKNLPGIDGLEVIRRAKELQPQCAPIMITGHATTDSVVEALRLGAVDYVGKPFRDLELLKEKLGKAIAQQRTLVERDALLARLREFEGELVATGRADDGPRSEAQMFNEILERRVDEATADLQRKCAILEAAQTSSGKTAAALATHTEELLHLVRNIQFADDDPVAVTRGVLSRVARLLSYNLDLLRKS